MNATVPLTSERLGLGKQADVFKGLDILLLRGWSLLRRDVMIVDQPIIRLAFDKDFQRYASGPLSLPEDPIDHSGFCRIRRPSSCREDNAT